MERVGRRGPGRARRLGAGLVVAAAVLAWSPASRAQQVQIIEMLPLELQELVVSQGGVVPGEAVPGGAAAGEAAGEPSPRLDKLKKLTFDRRPSAILAAWAAPEPEPLPFPEEPEPDAPTVDGTAEPGTEAGEAAATDESAAADDGAPATDDEPASEATPASGSATPSAASAAGPSASGAAPASHSPGPPPAPVPGGLTRGATQPGAGAPATAGTLQPGTAAPVQPAADEVATEVTPEVVAAGEVPDPAAEAERQAALSAAVDRELEIFQRHVTLGRWQAVADYLAGLTEEEAQAAYGQLLASLAAGPPRIQSPFARYAEVNVYAPDDVAGLLGACPQGFELDDVRRVQLAKLAQQCLEGGAQPEQLVERLADGVRAEDLPADELFLAHLLIDAGQPVAAGAFLPEVGAARACDDRRALNLLSQHLLADGDRPGHLEYAWACLMGVLAGTSVGDELEDEALARAVALAPRLADELGQSWLERSFRGEAARGQELLAEIGSTAAKAPVEAAKAKDQRLANLTLQSTAAEALLSAAPDLAGAWAGTLTLLARNWLTEARHSYEHDTSTSRGPSLERDAYGNFFYYNYRNQMRGNVPDPILTGELLDIRPSEAWLAHVDGTLRPELAALTAQLLLKIREEDEAFPYIEALAPSHPEAAEQLVNEFLTVWADNHDPNSDNNRRSSYIYFFGYEQRADAIPLTRSKQERNLAELAGWVRRLRALPLEGVDEQLLASCFMRAHSTAEVYRLETIEAVFGSLETLEPDTLSALVQRMRGNLVTVWRDPNTQKDAKTRRRQKDIQAEVLRGYEVARTVIERALADHPDSWRLRLALASVMHDEADYHKEVTGDSSYAGSRRAAFEVFARAADQYAAALPGLTDEEHSADVFLTWFYASLGACDLGAITDEHRPVASEVAAIRDAVNALPGPLAERHVGLVANTLFTRMSSVKPQVKYSYVRHGLEIVGDDERAIEARDVYEYYSDLVTEIQLETRLDGSDEVGPGEPFGVFVDLRHTREIEREAGGFSKYLTNQNNQGFSWNYGRPTENYRDKFEEVAREALSEHFEVHSITFNHAEAHSLAEAEYGWRVTPYAYLLLSARGPEVDRLPSLRLDLDFLDTTGYAVLPVESAPLVLDASRRAPVPRPFDELDLVQTLDERQADKGRLLLEVQATARGLVPEVERFLDLDVDGFEVAGIEDQGVAVDQFEEEGDGRGVLSTRLVTVEYRAREGLEQLPERFAFPAPTVDVAGELFQRYDDADMAEVAREIELMAEYGEPEGGAWWRWLLVLAAAIAGAWGGWRWWQAREHEVIANRYEMPRDASPFAVLGLLQRMREDERLRPGWRDELQAQIAQLEAYYFAEAPDGPAPDAAAIARNWVRRVG